MREITFSRETYKQACEVQLLFFLFCFRLNYRITSKDKEVELVYNFYTCKAIIDQCQGLNVVLHDFLNNMERQSKKIEEMRQASVNITRKIRNRGNKDNQLSTKEMGDSAFESKKDVQYVKKR